MSGRRYFQDLRFCFQRKGNRSAGRSLGLSVLFGLVLAALSVHWFSASLRPQLVALAEVQIRNYLTQTAVQALEERADSLHNMVTLQRETGGELTALTTDALRLNQLRSAVLEGIIAQSNNLNNDSLSVPLGSLTGIDLLSALGPRLPVKVISVTSVDGTFQNDFLSAGINQTLHRVILDINMTAKLLLPGDIVEVAVSVPICVSETIIIGQVPQAYVGLNK